MNKRKKNSMHSIYIFFFSLYFFLYVVELGLQKKNPGKNVLKKKKNMRLRNRFVLLVFFFPFFFFCSFHFFLNFFLLGFWYYFCFVYFNFHFYFHVRGSFLCNNNKRECVCVCYFFGAILNVLISWV